jgi:hypothetical protein
MKTLFGEPMQAAYVVRDIEASTNEWTRSLGVGPWFYAEHFALTNYRYRGRPTAGPVISVAQTYHGATQIELIQVRPGGGDNLYQETLDRGLYGIHHVAVMEPEFDRTYKKALAAGFRPVHEGDTYRGRLVYFENASIPDALIELIEATPDRIRIYGRMKETSAAWDGKDPVRTTWP